MANPNLNTGVDFLLHKLLHIVFGKFTRFMVLLWHTNHQSYIFVIISTVLFGVAYFCQCSHFTLSLLNFAFIFQ